jgi:hypothetical protein
MDAVSLWKAARHAALGVLWRVLVFGCAVLCFKGMLELRRWEETYAASDAWAAHVRQKEDLEWTSVLASAASSPLPLRTYTSEAVFYNALLQRVKDDALIWSNPADEARVAAYAKDLRERRRLEAEQRAMTAPYDRATVQKLKSMADLRQQIEDADGKEKETLETKLAAVAKEVGLLTTTRDSIAAPFRTSITVIDARTKVVQDGFKAAFEATKMYARPADGFLTHRWPETAIRIGYEKDPLHIVALLTWYGLEALIALLICVVVVPWLISLSSADPAGAQSAVTTKIKALLSSAFPKQMLSGAGKALAVGTVGLTSMVGAHMAAEGRNNEALKHPDKEVVAAADQKGGKGDRGDSGAQGPAGKEAEQPTYLPEIAEQLQAQKLTIEEQTKLLTIVAAALKKTLEDVNQTRDAAEKISDNVTKLAASSSDMSMSLGSLNEATRSIMFTTGWQARYLDDSMKRLQLANAETANGIVQIKSYVDASSQATATQDAATRQSVARPDGFLRPLNPFYRYQISPDVKEIIAKSIINPNTDQAQAVRDMLDTMVDQREMRIWEFQAQVRANTDTKGHPLLERMMPLIIHESRIQEVK